MVDGQNCGFVLPPNDLEHHTCICGDGYMNDEGTLIPGSIIKEGYALARSAYYAHKDCAQCQIEPQKCDWRRRHLPPREKRTTITAPPDGMFEFFLNSEGISKEILHAFLQSNSDGEITCLPGKRFKGESGFFVRSSFRINKQDHKQLKELTHLRHQGRSWKSQLLRKSPASKQPFNEFSRYMKSNTAASFSPARLPTAPYLAPVPQASKGAQPQYSRRAAIHGNPVGSQSPLTGTNFTEDLVLVTAEVSRMTVLGTYEGSTQGLPSENRTSNDSIHNPRTWDENNSNLSYAPSSGRRSQPAPTRIESAQSSMASQRTRRRSLFDRPQPNDFDDEDDYKSSRTAHETCHKSGNAIDGTRGSSQLHTLGPGSAGQFSTHHVDHESRGTAEIVTPHMYTTATTRQDEVQHLNQGQALSDDNELGQMNPPYSRRESYGRSNTNYDAPRESRSLPATVHRTQTYSNPSISHDAATRGFATPGAAITSSNQNYSRGNINYSAATAGYSPFPTDYSTQSYNSSNPNYSLATTIGHSPPVTTYNTSPPVQSRNPIVQDPNATQARPDAHDIPQTTKSPARRSSHTTRGQEAAPDDDDASAVVKVKCWLPAEGVDPEALALYVEYCIDPKSRVRRAAVKKRDGFLIEASRKLTSDEIADILKDSESWKRERERGRGALYRDSETARRRKARGGR